MFYSQVLSQLWIFKERFFTANRSATTKVRAEVSKTQKRENCQKEKRTNVDVDVKVSACVRGDSRCVWDGKTPAKQSKEKKLLSKKYEPSCLLFKRWGNIKTEKKWRFRAQKSELLLKFPTYKEVIN